MFQIDGLSSAGWRMSRTAYGIPATMEQERSVIACFERHYLSHQNEMIAALVQMPSFALKHGGIFRQERRAKCPSCPKSLAKLVGAGACESIGQFLLRLGQHMDCEMPA